MKKFVLLMVAVFLVTTLIGCSKKKKAEDVDSMTNGVSSENVVSVTDATAGTNAAVPVVVDNAEAVPQTTGEMAAGVASSTTDKATPKQIQQALKNAGFYSGKIDGTIGPKTKKAIEEFQAQNGLKADGKVGARTWKALSAHLGQTSEVANPTAQTQAVNQ
jgi:peptidoglycan hydrolase-like protein with peptidoglycan-binding domain